MSFATCYLVGAIALVTDRKAHVCYEAKVRASDLAAHRSHSARDFYSAAHWDYIEAAYALDCRTVVDTSVAVRSLGAAGVEYAQWQIERQAPVLATQRPRLVSLTRNVAQAGAYANPYVDLFRPVESALDDATRAIGGP